ncbi:MAG: N-acetylmuramoyl-L-alanine amidase [Bifidobacteriaceae bacterium]|jgi:N-acetylmuramoyl-L-alanine amidase|nr:N-acetylmuramoyl-L-alanine amidase [Bifidobacteriaceae bacterium]
MSSDSSPDPGRHRLEAPRGRGLLVALVPVALILALAGAGLAWISLPDGSDKQTADAAGSSRPPSASPSPRGTPSATPTGSAPSADASTDASASAEPSAQANGVNGADATPGAGDTTGSGGSGSLAGRVVALDPGHGPAGGSRTQVPDGRGGTKDCQTSGTSTDAGYAEHAFNYDVALRVRDLLQAQGATVLLTRGNSASEQVCVDKRGTFAQDHDADLLVSIHGDGNNDRSVKGFFAIVSSPPLNSAQGQPSLDLAEAVLARLREAGFTQNAAYSGGVSKRSDIAGVALSARPVVMFELGEMRNPDEAAQMSSADGRGRYATAVAAGITDWLAAHPAG